MTRQEAIQAAIDAARGEPIREDSEPWMIDGSEHVNEAGCWCHPILVFKSDDGSEVWIHNQKQ